MRRLSVFALALLAMFIPCLTSPALADSSSALKEVRSQPHTVDALVDNKGNLFVLVKPSGVNWSSYASALCQVVMPHQAQIFQVRIIDLTKTNYNKPPTAWPFLANVKCSN